MNGFRRTALLRNPGPSLPGTEYLPLDRGDLSDREPAAERVPALAEVLGRRFGAGVRGGQVGAVHKGAEPVVRPAGEDFAFQIEHRTAPPRAAPANGEPELDLFGDPINPEPSAATLERQAKARAAQEATRASLEKTLNSVFDGDGWRRIDAEEADARADQCAARFRQITGARWGTHFRMRHNGRVRYFLLHLTNHSDGRDLMKECMWKACPDGGFYASKSDRPDQVVLIEPKPNLKPLRTWVMKCLAASPRRWHFLTDELREERWLGKRLNEVIQALRRENEIVGSEFAGQFAQTNNPLLSLPTPSGVS